MKSACSSYIFNVFKFERNQNLNYRQNPDEKLDIGFLL